jgi:hypothetical protein
MGWWVIEPDTGMPKKDAVSKAKPKAGGVFVNAFPGIDDDPQSHYLGDGPMDWADDAADKLQSLFGPSWKPTAEEVRRLINQDLVDPRHPQSSADEAKEIRRQFWEFIESDYTDSWQRKPTPAETRCVQSWSFMH